MKTDNINSYRNHASPYSDFLLHHQNQVRASEFSSRGYFSNGFDYSSDSSSSTTPFSFKYYTSEGNPSVSHEPYFNDILGDDDDGLGLAECFNRMSVGGVRRGGGFERADPHGFGFGGHVPRNVEDYGSLYASLRNNVSNFEGFQSSHFGVKGGSSGYVEPEFHGVGPEYVLGDSMGTVLNCMKQQNKASAFCCGANGVKNQMGYMLEHRKKELLGECYYRHVEEHNPSFSMPYLHPEYANSQMGGMESSRDKGLMYPVSSPRFPSLAHQLCVENGSHDDDHHLVVKQRTRGNPTRECDDGLVVHGSKIFNHGVTKAGLQASKANKEKVCTKKMAMRTEGEKSSRLDWNSYNVGSSGNDSCSQSNTDSVKSLLSLGSLADIHGYIFFLAKHQHGGRYLQKILDEGSLQDKQLIFDGIINHVLELTTDPFGNYLMQKFLDICNEHQRMQLVIEVTKQPGELVRVSLDTHGTRVVQRMIDTVVNGKEVSLIISSLLYDFVDLIKDPNGNHVVHRCLESFSTEQNSFIFDAAARFCVEIATQRHGCCALQKCISHATGRHRDKLVTEVSRNGLLLSQDPFGNYVVQYVIELNIPHVMIRLISQLKGHFVLLSMQKFGSHVVEKCIKHCEESQAKIIQEFLSVSHFEQLLQDPYANYVIQSALSVTKGPLHAALVKAVKPHTVLRHSPYCKKIFTKDLLKK